jgi:hypothetical protein
MPGVQTTAATAHHCCNKESCIAAELLLHSPAPAGTAGRHQAVPPQNAPAPKLAHPGLAAVAQQLREREHGVIRG